MTRKMSLAAVLGAVFTIGLLGGQRPVFADHDSPRYDNRRDSGWDLQDARRDEQRMCEIERRCSDARRDRDGDLVRRLLRELDTLRRQVECSRRDNRYRRDRDDDRRRDNDRERNRKSDWHRDRGRR